MWPLPVPHTEQSVDGDALPDYSAATLFLERAAESVPDFHLTPDEAPAVAEICRRLDGLPLALELAAARLALLDPRSLPARLERALPLLTGGARSPGAPAHATRHGAVEL